MQVIWFKRDLRIHDHPALTQAAMAGLVLPLFIIEPELWCQPDMSTRQYLFMTESLAELDAALAGLGQGLIVRVGAAADVLAQIHADHGIDALWSHQETWNGWTYQRDLTVGQWAKSSGIAWHEPVQNGVVRRLDTRNGWAGWWNIEMSDERAIAPQSLALIDMKTDPIPKPSAIGLIPDGCTQRQPGGRAAGLHCLRSFLHDRGQGYTREMSSPVTAFDACSRISPHIAFGTVSVREAYFAAEKRRIALRDMPPTAKGKWPNAVNSFSKRLRWHCHFMQKLEDAPQLEFEPMHSAFKGLRDDSFRQDYYDAWVNGQTGYPLVDACMRSLTATGWLTFRMRAMVMSFASYHLWLPWQRTAPHLARMFTDYEPGIHYPQVQMQSGTTGINSIRIYNPIKQSQDQDPTGVFIRHWVPELADVDTTYIHTPWDMVTPPAGYPAPIVDEPTARKFAASQLYGIKSQTRGGAETKAVLDKHGSRKSPRPKRARASAAKPKSQTEFDF